MSEKEDDIKQLDLVLEKLDNSDTEFKKSDLGITMAEANSTTDSNNA